MKRRILLVDDEVAVLLTMKAVLEISGFDVDTAASAREGKSRLKTRTYDMVITDMRMESEESGREVIVAARTATTPPSRCSPPSRSLKTTGKTWERTRCWSSLCRRGP
jgi:DNA-binding response OmpR family regulator